MERRVSLAGEVDPPFGLQTQSTARVASGGNGEARRFCELLVLPDPAILPRI